MHTHTGAHEGWNKNPYPISIIRHEHIWKEEREEKEGGKRMSWVIGELGKALNGNSPMLWEKAFLAAEMLSLQLKMKWGKIDTGNLHNEICLCIQLPIVQDLKWVRIEARRDNEGNEVGSESGKKLCCIIRRRISSNDDDLDDDNCKPHLRWIMLESFVINAEFLNFSSAQLWRGLKKLQNIWITIMLKVYQTKLLKWTSSINCLKTQSAADY